MTFQPFNRDWKPKHVKIKLSDLSKKNAEAGRAGMNAKPGDKCPYKVGTDEWNYWQFGKQGNLE